MVDRPASRYPYNDDGTIPVPADADWLDPFIALSFAAAATRRIALATGVLLLPEHQPLVVAKQAASLDVLSGGRLRLGVGVGWSREEFAALGVPFARRGARTAEYVAALRALWRDDDPTTFAGDFVGFEGVRVNPKPTRGTIPIVVGGTSDAALARAAAWGDGWYGFALGGLDEVRDRVGELRARARACGRDPDRLDVAVALAPDVREDPAALAAAGVTQHVLVATPPQDAGAVEGWVRSLAAGTDLRNT
jgi:probable F420-dependent oxidoreductase